MFVIVYARPDSVPGLMPNVKDTHVQLYSPPGTWFQPHSLRLRECLYSSSSGPSLPSAPPCSLPMPPLAATGIASSSSSTDSSFLIVLTRIWLSSKKGLGLVVQRPVLVSHSAGC